MERGGGSGNRAAAARVGFDVPLLLRSLGIAALLCWPLLIAGRPAYFPDSIGYYNSGRAAVGLVGRTLLPAAQPPASVAAATSDDTKAARSMEYGILAYVFGGRDGAMLPLALLQALLAGFTVAVFLAAARVPRRPAALVIGVVALATPAAWVACLTVPDIFAGLLILAVATLVLARDRLRPSVALALAAIAALAVVSHASHLALAALLVPLAALLGGARAWLWAALPAVLGVALVAAGSAIGFGELSVAPKRFPLTLARSIGDGPGRWYLQRHCATAHYAVCEIYGTAIPTTSSAFLWRPTGVTARATPAQMDRLRAEEATIVWRATLAYPLQQAAASLTGIGRQLVYFRVRESNFDERIVGAAGGGVAFAADPRMPTWLQQLAYRLSLVSALAALLWLAAGWRRASPLARRTAVLVVFGLVANAAICAVLSAVSDRYQARVVWLLPLAAVLVPPPARLARKPIVGQT